MSSKRVGNMSKSSYYRFMAWIKIFSIIFLLQVIRYFIFAGGAYAYFWKYKKVDSEKRKFQKQPFKWQDIKREMSYSIMTSAIFAAVLGTAFSEPLKSYTKIYTDFSQHGFWWLPVSLMFMLLMHDTYFYWMHRTLHHPKLFKIFHKVHHESKNPTPFAAFSFHPLEALTEIAWVLPIFFIVPLHQSVIVVFSIMALAMNVMGHLGVEIYPESWRTNPVLKYLNRSASHNYHHAHFKGNYGLYFNWWDRWQKTLVQ